MFNFRKPHILVVDDEKDIREIVCLMLGNNRYHLLETGNPKEAVQIAAGLGKKLDLLLTDVLMPHMNGRELANRLGLTHPELKVLFMSAYSNEIISTHGICPDGVELIRKPFTRMELLMKVDSVIKQGVFWKQFTPGHS
jgi:two-component system, cell cycle sensor histidine kinase and response regulator CckA